jgi:hypothetical protein
MVPSELINFFTVSAGIGATLIGLIFVSVSIAPEQTVMEGAPIEKQAVAASSFSALLNGFFISLFALIPVASSFISAAFAMSLVGLSTIILLSWSLFKHPGSWQNVLRRSSIILIGVVLYAIELYQSIVLTLTPSNTAAVYSVAYLIGIGYVMGLLRAWQLIGARRFRLSNILNQVVEARLQRNGGDDDVSQPASKSTAE